MIVKRLVNPYPKNNCFCCSADNPIGLHMNFEIEGEECVCYWKPDRLYEGWIGIIHGGLQTTMMDEIGMWLINMKMQTTGFTRNLEAKFIKNVNSTSTIEIRARIRESNRMFVFVDTWIMQDGVKCTEALVKYYVVDKETAARDFSFPGITTEDVEVDENSR